jgi:hypothetical protein
MKTARYGGAVATYAAVLLLSACADGSGDNSDRANLFTDIASGTNFTAPSDLAGLQGSATYSGAAVADFGDFGGTADATIRADFSNRTLSGRMTNWQDRNPAAFELDGTVVLSNGSIANDGTFAAQLAGNIERSERGPNVLPQTLVVFGGVATGEFYDSLNGRKARVVQGSFEGATVDGGEVSGTFIAER